MNNRIKLYFANFLVVAAGLWLTSCSASDDSLGSDKGADVAKNEKVLTLRINTGATSFGSRTTDITTDPGTTAENTINRLTIGIFGTNGTAKFVQDLSEGSGSNTFTADKAKNQAIANIVATSLANGDRVLVAVNAPANNFSGVASVSDFNSKTEQAVAALTYTKGKETENTVEESNNIPMYGEGTLTQNGNDFSATVSVKHLLSKVTLENLTVDFDASGPYSAATFTPTAFFLINEPDALIFNNNAWGGVGNLLQGYDKTDLAHGTYKEFLKTGNLTEHKLSGVKTANTASFGTTKYYFYTMPNSAIQTDGKNTKLVIAGKFKTNTGSTEETVFYPVPLNANFNDKTSAYQPAETGTDVYKVYPNKNYKCSVVIKTKGATSPFDNLDPKKAAITVTVTGFQDVDQTTVFK